MGKVPKRVLPYRVLETGLEDLLLAISENYLKQLEEEHRERDLKEDRARKYASRRNGLVLDVGTGLRFWEPSRGDVNVDIGIPYPKKQNFVRASAEALPFRDRAFSSVLLFHILEHIPNPSKGISEAKRVGERVYVCLPKSRGLRTWFHSGHRWIPMRGNFYPNPLYKE